MAKNDLFDFSNTAADNTDVATVSISENCPAGNINDAIRALMSIVLRAAGNKGSDIASASTCAIAAAGTSLFALITGTTAITSFGTVRAGTLRIVQFDGILTLTHNATSLILPGSTNITTAQGDVAFMMSLGSGNWKCLHYSPISGTVVGGFSSVTATSTDAGATAGPDIKAFRNSASPADNDLIGRLLLNGRDESSNEDTYASLEAQILDATNGTEDALLLIKTIVAGSLAARLSIGAGLYIGSATGGDPGAGKVNATGYQLNGASIVHGIAQVVTDTDATYTTCSTDLPVDNTVPQNTEGDEILSVAITPKQSTSTLRITFTAMVGVSTAGMVGAGLFVDSTAAALNGTSVRVPSTAGTTLISLVHFVSAASTSSRTYKIRVGPDTGSPVSAFINGDNSGRLMGGSSIAVLQVEEILAQ